MFQLIHKDNGAPFPHSLDDAHPGYDRKGITEDGPLFNYGANANKARVFWFENYRFELTIKRIATDEWQARERNRFADGTYQALPWVSESWFERAETKTHFAHVSTEDGAKIAYTENDTKGIQDKKTRMKPGRYLKQFYGDRLSTEEIAALSVKFSKEYEDCELLFAQTEDEIEHVYTKGPRSCMSYDESDYASDRHPTRVYAAGDLQVAYMERDGSITARALVWPAKKLYSRIYGDELRLESLLEDAGYEYGQLTGAKLQKVTCGRGFVMPYVDCTRAARDAGDHLVLDNCGTIKCRETNGLSCPAMVCCCCEEYVDECEAQSHDGDYYCQSCFNDQFSYCEYYEEYQPSDGFQQVIVGTRSNGSHRTQFWSEAAVENHASVCAKTGELYADDYSVIMENDDRWGQDVFDEHGFVCDGNGGNYSLDEAITLEDGTLWSRDHFESHGVEIDGKYYDKDDAPDPDDEDTPEDVSAASDVLVQAV